MSYQPNNNRYQPLSLFTQSPIRLDYHRALPPLADHPVLELRRPANKDACFAVSALSPNMSKRFGGDWDTLSGRTSLLDRYLGQQAISPVVQELPGPFSEQAPRPPVTPAHANVPANSKALWALMSQSVSVSISTFKTYLTTTSNLKRLPLTSGPHKQQVRKLPTERHKQRARKLPAIEHR